MWSYHIFHKWCYNKMVRLFKQDGGTAMPTEKFTNIYKVLKDRILSGEYPNGAYIPSEHMLIEEFSCSRNTVRRAISQLADEVFVQSMRGKGVIVIWVRPVQSEFAFSDVETLREAAARNNLSYETKVRVFLETEVDSRIARRTGFPVGEKVVYLQRIRIIDNIPMIIDNNWFLADSVQGLTKEIAENSVYDYIENVLGVRILTTLRRLTVEKRTEADEKILKMNDYDCVAVVSSKTYDMNGLMFEYTESRHRPDKFIFYSQARRKG